MVCILLLHLFLHSLLQLTSPARTVGMMQVAYCGPETISRHGDLATHDLCTPALHVSAGKPDLLLLPLQALQLQRSFGLLNEFLPFSPISDAALPVCYFHPCYIALYITFPSIFWSS